MPKKESIDLWQDEDGEYLEYLHRMQETLHLSTWGSFFIFHYLSSLHASHRIGPGVETPEAQEAPWRWLQTGLIVAMVWRLHFFQLEHFEHVEPLAWQIFVKSLQASHSEVREGNLQSYPWSSHAFVQLLQYTHWLGSSDSQCCLCVLDVLQRVLPSLLG